MSSGERRDDFRAEFIELHIHLVQLHTIIHYLSILHNHPIELPSEHVFGQMTLETGVRSQGCSRSGFVRWAPRDTKRWILSTEKHDSE